MDIIALNRICWKSDLSGGAETRLKHVLTGLADRGHDVTLICSKHPELPDKEMDSGVKIKRVGYPTRERARIHHLTISLHYLLNDYNPDVLYTNQRAVPWIVPREDQVSIYHETLPDTKLLYELYNKPLVWAGKVMEKMVQYIEKKVPKVVVSESTLSDVEKFNQGDVQVIENGLDADEYLNLKESETPQISYLGRIQPKKGAGILPEIHQEVEEKFGNVTFKVMGGDVNPEIGEKLEKYAGENERFEYLGFVSKDRKNKIISESWVHVVPSQKEGWGLTVLEANASGTPVVASRVEGLIDSVVDGYNGFLVERSPEKFGGRIVSLLENPKLRKDMGENGKERASKFTWDRTVDLTEKFFQSQNDRYI